MSPSNFVILVICSIITPSAIADCTFDFKGDGLLKALADAGIMPSATGGGCSYDAQNFQFAAGPNDPCIVRFRSRALLADKWDFVKVTGKGAFQVTRDPGELIITIDPMRGFRPDSFTVRHTTDSENSKCKAPALPTEIVGPS